MVGSFLSAPNMSGHMFPSQLPRRLSRSSNTQPACYASRVEKPKSHHNSPRTADRRRTTTESKLYASLDDHYRAMFGITEPDVAHVRPQPTRPMSWHPSSAQFQARSSSYFEPMQDSYAMSPRHSAHGSDFYSLSTRNSLIEPMPPALGVSNFAMHRGSDESDYSWHSMSQQTPSSFVHSTINTPVSEPLPWYLQQWAQKSQAEALVMAQSESTDFLPIQHPTAQDTSMDDEGEQLVALGLYDLPETSLSWPGLEGTGKGLKLEETWQPPEVDEDDDDDDDEEEEDDDASSEGSAEEPSPPLPVVQQPVPQLEVPVHVQTQTSGNMNGQSFFFDEDETVSKEWWFQQLKQPAMPVQDTGLGYGWL